MAGPWNNSTTAASNTSIGGTGIAGNNAVSNFDNGLRETIAQMKRGFEDLGGAGTVGGTADAITLALSSGSPTTYQNGQFFTFIAGSTNTGAATLNIDSVGAEPIKKLVAGTETALAAGDIVASNHYGVIWRADFDSSNGGWLLVDLSNNLSSVGQDILPGTDSAYDLGRASSAFAETHSDAFYTGGNRIANIISISTYSDPNTPYSTTTTTSYAVSGAWCVGASGLYTPTTATSKLMVLASAYVWSEDASSTPSSTDVGVDAIVRYYNGASWVNAPGAVGCLNRIVNVDSGAQAARVYGTAQNSVLLDQTSHLNGSGDWQVEWRFSASYTDNTARIQSNNNLIIEFEPEA